MRLWTIQPADVWRQVSEDGVAHVDRRFMLGDGYVSPAYEWLLDQLVRRQSWHS